MEAEANRLKMESDKANRAMEAEANRAMEADNEYRLKQLEIEALKIQHSSREERHDEEPRSNNNNNDNYMIRGEAPRMEEINFDLDNYLTVFERTAKAQQWPERLWVAKLACKFNRKAQEIYARVDNSICQDYAQVKIKLLEGFDIGPERYRNNFNNTTRNVNENFKEYAVRLNELIKKWLKGCECTTIEELIQILLMEKFYSSTPKELVAMLKEKRYKELSEVSKLADELDSYRDKIYTKRTMSERFSNDQNSHHSRWDQGRHQSNFPRSSNFAMPRYNHGFRKQSQPRPHFNKPYNRFNHSADSKSHSQSNGWQQTRPVFRPYQNNFVKGGQGNHNVTYPNNRSNSHSVNFVDNHSRRNYSNRDTPGGSIGNKFRCEYCHTNGHTSLECVTKGVKWCKICNTNTHNTKWCKSNIPNPVHFVNELHTMEKLYNKELMSEADVNGQAVLCLRDTGSTITLVKSDLIPVSQTACEYTVCTTAFGTRHTIPLAWVDVKTTYGCGKIKVGLVDNLPVDCILGNDVLDLEQVRTEVCAAVTRARALSEREAELAEAAHTEMAKLRPGYRITMETIPEEEAKIIPIVSKGDSTYNETDLNQSKIKPNEVNIKNRSDEINEAMEERELFKLEALQGVTKQEFISEQQSDKTLTRVRVAVTKISTTDNSNKSNATHFFMDKGLLFRKYYPPRLNYIGNKSSLKQLVVPAKYRRAILSISHDAPLSSHVGVAKVQSSLLLRFYWPGLFRDALQYVRTCPECQQVGKRVKKAKAPMVVMPTVNKPFERIIMDVVGPLDKSLQGNIFMLVIIDTHSHYPEAIPLKTVDSKRIATELVKLFSRVGLPEIVQSDQGQNFMSGLMSQLYTMLGVKHIKSSPYHPETNALVERLNGTIKRLLRTCLIGKDIRMWDVVLPLVLFSIRSSKHESTGFTPFQLLYGYDIRGPLDIVKELWTQKESEEKNLHQYIIDLRASMREIAKEAVKHETNVKVKNKIRYDKTSEVTKFKVGDKVFVLLPFKCHSLSPVWHGPYEVKEKLGEVDYVIFLHDRVKKQRVVHVNMLRKYEPRVSCFVISENDFDVEGPATFPKSGIRTMDSRDIKIADNLDSFQREQVRQLLDKYDNIFSDLPGSTELVQHQIRTINDKPIHLPPYQIPQALIADVEKEIKIGLDLGLIEPVINGHNPTAYAAPTIVIKKKEANQIRVVVDYRALNRVTIHQRYGIPNSNHLIDKVAGAKYLSLCDLVKGYNQVRVCPEDIHKTGFLCLGKHYVCKYMSFGLQGSSSTFQMLMDMVLKGKEHYAASYIDDVCIFSMDWEDHLKHLDSVFKVLQEHGLTVKPTKVQLGMHQLKFLGHVVGNGRKRIDESKLSVLNDIKIPRTKKDIRSFMGFINFYRHYIPAFSELSAPLTNLLRKECSEIIAWTADTSSAFEKLKHVMSHAPVLISPDFEKTFYLEVDSSMLATGACLFQKDENTCRPILFISKKFSEAETKLSALERECLGSTYYCDPIKILFAW